MFESRIKIFSIITFATIVAFVLCFHEANKLSEFQQQKNFLSEKNAEHIKLAKEISENCIELSKPVEKVFCEKSHSKEVIKKFIQEFSKDKILLKHSQSSNAFGEIEKLELKFTSLSERKIYEFLQNFYFEINGLVFFDLVNITKKSDGKYAVEISCKIVRYSKKFEKYVRVKNLQSKIPIKNYLHIFKINREKYTLDGIIKNAVAFINRCSKKVGDEIGEYELVQIAENSITLKSRNFKNVIFIGESWSRTSKTI